MDERRVRSLLRDSVDNIQASPALRARVDESLEKPARRSGRSLMVATVAVVGLLVVLAVSVGGRSTDVPAAQPDTSDTSVPLPSDTHVTPPAASLAPQLRALSGEWRGKWDGVLDSKLVVERIDAHTANVIYAWGVSQLVTTPGWMRRTARVTPPSTITWGGSGLRPTLCGPGATKCSMVFTFTISPDRASIDGQRIVTTDNGGYQNDIAMERVGSSKASPSSRPVLIAVGAIAIAIALVAIGMAVERRRRAPTV